VYMKKGCVVREERKEGGNKGVKTISQVDTSCD